MSKDSNTNLFTTHNSEVILNNISFSNCKECADLVASDAGLICANPNPTTDTCTVLALEFNK